MDRLVEALKEYWGYDDFRGIQRPIIESIMAGQDTLGLMPTGGGKSITFQLPAVLSQGVCLVITPLIALMKDQVEHLTKQGIRAAAIYTGLTHEKVLLTLDNAVFGAYKLLYVSPERLSSDLFRTKLGHMRVSFICVDEAHCISQWGYDFRPSYLNIRQIRDVVPSAPVLALTATATPSVIKDIQEQLGFKAEKVFRMSFERKNLAYKVECVNNKEQALKHLLLTREGSIIVYVRSRQRCRELAELITGWGQTVTFYHAGLSDSDKDERQRKWQSDKIRIMVATNAFGMGIDKPDVRLVVHMDIPDAIESYFQEAGRAGRDGLRSEAILLYDKSNITNLRKRVAETFPEKETICNIYEEVCDFLHVALGDGKGIRREFNLQEFCVNFHHFPTLVISSLNLLTKAGYIDFTGSDDGISRIMFTLLRDELYRIHSDEKKKDDIMRCLLRNYSGLFVNYTAIDESLITKQTGIPEQEVYDELRELTKRRILNYIPKKNIPHIVFTTERRKKETIKLSSDIYKKRKANYSDRIEAMIDYVTEDDTCRNRFLLKYFGEKIKEDCGQCDICLEDDDQSQVEEMLKIYTKNNPSITLEEAKAFTKQELVRQIKEAGRIHPFLINLDNLDTKLAKQIIEEMSSNGEIATDECLRIYLVDSE